MAFLPSLWSPEHRAQAGSSPGTQPRDSAGSTVTPVSVLTARCAPFLGTGSSCCWHLQPPWAGVKPGHPRRAPALPVSPVLVSDTLCCLAQRCATVPASPLVWECHYHYQGSGNVQAAYVPAAQSQIKQRLIG